MTHSPYLNSIMDYNISKMEGYKTHPFNILQIKKGIVTIERHNKDSRFISLRFHLLYAPSFYLPRVFNFPRKAYLEIKRCP